MSVVDAVHAVASNLKGWSGCPSPQGHPPFSRSVKVQGADFPSGRNFPVHGSEFTDILLTMYYELTIQVHVRSCEAARTKVRFSETEPSDSICKTTGEPLPHADVFYGSHTDYLSLTQISQISRNGCIAISARSLPTSSSVRIPDGSKGEATCLCEICEICVRQKESVCETKNRTRTKRQIKIMLQIIYNEFNFRK